MTAIKQQTMYHRHQSPTHPGDRPHVVYTNAPGHLNPDQLADRMGHLNVHQDMSSPPDDQRTRDASVGFDVNERVETCYEGYTFFKAQPTPGHNPSWNKVSRTQMNLDQNDLASLVRRMAKRNSVATQYQSLTVMKRKRVDELVDELRQKKPQFQWTCVYVKEDRKNLNRGYETTSMDVILMGKPLKPSFLRAHPADVGLSVQPEERMPTQVQHPLPDNGPRPFTIGGQHNDQWSGQSFQQAPMPPQVHNTQQQPSQNYQHIPPPHPGAQHPMEVPQYSSEGHWAHENPNGGQPMRPHPVWHGQTSSLPAYDSTTMGKDYSAQGFAEGPNHHGVHYHGQRYHHEKQYHSQQANPSHRRHKTPVQPRGSEPDLIYESASSGDDSLAHDGEDSAAEFSENEARVTGKHTEERGSLYRRHSSSNPKRPRRVYRKHYRKTPQKTAGHKSSRNREDVDIDVIPEDSRYAPRRPVGSRNISRQPFSQPAIIHQPTSSDDLNQVYLSQVRGGRTQNDLRSRMLNNWETNLEEREKMVEYQNQMLEERILHERLNDDLLGRYRPSRERRAAYRRRYYPLDTLY